VHAALAAESNQMALDSSRIVDALHLDPVSCEAVLSLADEQEWGALKEHLWKLQEKINAYIAYIEAGEIKDVFPEAAERASRIDLVFKYAPPAEANWFFEHTSQVLHGAGIGFSWRVFAGENAKANGS
jgi:hypothetical protein